MFEADYLIQERSPHDRRSVRVKLSEKGLALHNHLRIYFEKQVQMLGDAGLSNEEISTTIESLRKFERFWTSIINYNRPV